MIVELLALTEALLKNCISFLTDLGVAAESWLVQSLLNSRYLQAHQLQGSV